MPLLGACCPSLPFPPTLVPFLKYSGTSQSTEHSRAPYWIETERDSDFPRITQLMGGGIIRSSAFFFPTVKNDNFFIIEVTVNFIVC